MKKLLLLIIIIIITGCTDVKKENEIIIDGKKYEMILEDNDAADAFKKLFPLELKMEDLNENEKYAYLDHSMPTKEYYPHKVKKGDIMLYGDTCIVIFYKTIETKYDYTKIGHINNLKELDDKRVKVEFK